MPVSKQLQADLSGDDIIRDNQVKGAKAPKQDAATATRHDKREHRIALGESLSDLARRKRAAPRDAGHT